MGSSASVTSCHRAPATTCRICLMSPEDQELIDSGGGGIHSWPASESHRLAEADADEIQFPHASFLMDDQMISPCDCAGTQKYVHLHCLLRWIALHPSKSTNCDVCNSAFRGHVPAIVCHASMHGVFRIHRTLFARCSTNTRYNPLHSALLSLQQKTSLLFLMTSGGVVVQTAPRASAPAPLDGSSSGSSAAAQLLTLILASRRSHWNCSAFLILFSRPRAASDGSTALIAVNITQQRPLQECAAAAHFQLSSGVPCALFRGGPCGSNTPLAVLRIHGVHDWRFLFRQAQSVHHQNLVHSWLGADPPCCFYRQAAALCCATFPC
jgi:hypothetical protein